MRCSDSTATAVASSTFSAVMGAWTAVASVTDIAPSSAAKSMVEMVSRTARSAVLGSVNVL